MLFKKEEEHLVNSYKQLLSPLGIPLSETQPRLFITPQEEAVAKTEVVTFLPQSQGGIKAPHFVMWVKDYLEKKL